MLAQLAHLHPKRRNLIKNAELKSHFWDNSGLQTKFFLHDLLPSFSLKQIFARELKVPPFENYWSGRSDN